MLYQILSFKINREENSKRNRAYRQTITWSEMFRFFQKRSEKQWPLSFITGPKKISHKKKLTEKKKEKKRIHFLNLFVCFAENLSRAVTYTLCISSLIVWHLCYNVPCVFCMSVVFTILLFWEGRSLRESLKMIWSDVWFTLPPQEHL